MITILILEFLLFSFLGWVIDSFYRSLKEKKWINAGYFKGPICPIYGFGALIMLYLFKNLIVLPLLLQIIITSLAMIFVEYVGGIFSEKILKIKLWDYSSSRFHLRGYVDLLHSWFWFLLTVFFYFALYPFILRAETHLLVPEAIEFPMLLLFLFGGIWLTLRKAPVHFLDIHGKIMNMTVEKYKGLHSMIRKLSRISSAQARKKLQRLITQQLKNTNATLKKMPFKFK